MAVTERISALASHQRFFKSLTKEIPVWRTQFDEALRYQGDLAVLCLPPRQDGKAYEYFQLKLCRVPPTYSDAGASRHWWDVKPERSFTGVWMDPSQDLMVLTHIKRVVNMDESPFLSLQVLSISSGKILSDTDISFRLPQSRLRWKMEQCFIWDDMLAISLWRRLPSSDPRKIFILGWKDGRVRASLFTPQFTCDFRFLSRSTFIIGYRPIESPTNIGIRLFSFDPDVSSDIERPERHPYPHLIAIFHLPTLSIPSTKLHILMIGMEHTGCHNIPENHRIFEASHNRGVLTISIHSTDRNRPSIFFIDPSIFRSFTTTQKEVASIPWSAWGPRNTRLLGFKFKPSSCLCRCYGTRAYLPGHILDFNALDVRRDDHLRQLGKTERVLEGRLYPGRDLPPYGKGDLFQDDHITTMLPFRRIIFHPEHSGARPGQIWPGEDWIMSGGTRS
ncbi:hypothetical protein NLI96_g10037 [Meripilus lineatus]|uniref:Uncharacterized protein n=1 Tax=Meripilus lineatus TaxID=2056292 RepID=A0AAD5UUN0_9APHY|nr:hypothetical protein NLI96_g10037 [Physisporinus lineatus]